MKAPDAARRPHHQQRLDLGPRAAAEFGALHRDQARDHRPDQDRPRSTAAIRHRLRPDRHRQRRDRADARMANGVPQADGRIAVEPRMDVDARRPTRSLHGGLPLSSQRPVHDRHGDQDAVRRAGVARLRSRCRATRFDGLQSLFADRRATGAKADVDPGLLNLHA